MNITSKVFLEVSSVFFYVCHHFLLYELVLWKSSWGANVVSNRV